MAVHFAQPTGAGGGPVSGPDQLQLFWRLFNRMPAIVGYWDASCRNVLANDNYLKWLGFPPAKMTGVHIRDVLGEVAYRESVGYIEAALAGEEQQFDLTVVDAQDHERHTQVALVPDVVDEGVTGYFVMVTDITQRVLAERAAARSVESHRALARSMPNAFVLLFDPDLRYRVAEGPALATWGAIPAEMEGQTLSEVSPGLVAELEPRYRRALLGETVSWDRDVQGLVFSSTVGPVSDASGVVFAGLLVGTDVTAQRRREATSVALRQVSEATAEGATVEQIVDLVVTSVQRLFGCEHASVARFDAAMVSVLAVHPPLQSVPPGLRMDAAVDSDSALAGVLRDGRPHLYQFQATSTGRAGHLYRDGIRLAAAAPITVNGSCWGAVGIALRTTDGGEEALAHLAEFAHAVATCISSSAAWDALAAVATTDVLTGLPNRRAFEECLTQAAHGARRRGHPLSIVMLDIDHFKQINDTYGHPAGDAVLAGVAQRMASVIRNNEFLARVGGEEFALLLPHADAHEAVAAAERIRVALGAETVNNIVVTVSAGTATLVGAAAKAATLVASADQALYRSKRAGRDTVTMSAPADA